MINVEKNNLISLLKPFQCLFAVTYVKQLKAEKEQAAKKASEASKSDAGKRAYKLLQYKYVSFNFTCFLCVEAAL